MDEKSLTTTDKEIFAKGYYNFYKLFLLFLIGSLIGDIYEMTLHFLKHGEFVTRSALIYGPFNPIYGIGLIMFVLILGKVKKTHQLFLIGSAIGGLFEYSCSFIQEKLFGSLSWDYKDLFLNINGRTTVIIAMFWGVLAVLVVKFIAPFFSSMIERLPVSFGKPMTIFLVIFMTLNIIISCLAVYRDSERHKNIAPKNFIDVFLDKYYPQEVIEKIYNNAVYVTNENSKNGNGEFKLI